MRGTMCPLGNHTSGTVPTGVAGTPTTTAPAGTSLVTTAPGTHDRSITDRCARQHRDVGALVLEPAAAVGEHIFTDTYVLAEVGTEGREELERLWDLVGDQLTHQRLPPAGEG